MLRKLCVVTTSETKVKACRTCDCQVVAKWCRGLVAREGRVLTEEQGSTSAADDHVVSGSVQIASFADDQGDEGLCSCCGINDPDGTVAAGSASSVHF